MAATLQAAFSNAFSQMEITAHVHVYFDSNFIDIVPKTIIGSGNVLAGYWGQGITWSNVDSDLWYHMVSLGHNELTFTVPFIFIISLLIFALFFKRNTQNFVTSPTCIQTTVCLLTAIKLHIYDFTYDIIPPHWNNAGINFLMENRLLLILHNQNCCYWWFDDYRNQNINRLNVNLFTALYICCTGSIVS